MTTAIQRAAFVLAVLVASEAGATNYLLPGKKLLLKNDKLVWIAKDPGIQAPADDVVTVNPRPQLTVTTLLDDQQESITLDATWSVNGTATVYKYKNLAAPAGDSPCKIVLLKPGKLIKAVCKLPLVDLSTPPLGGAAVSLTVGQDRYCTQFNNPSLYKDEAGKFLAKNAVAPDGCDIVGEAHCGAFLTSDNFDDNVTNTCMWTSFAGGTGPTIAETGGQVLVTFPTTSDSPGPLVDFGGLYSSVCRVRGDFSMEVDYHLGPGNPWPSQNGVRVALSALNPVNGGVNLTERASLGNPLKDFPTQTNREVYVLHASDGVNGFTATTHNDGRLRMERSAGMMTGSFWNGVSFQAIHSAPVGDADLQFIINAFSTPAYFTDQAVTAAFDNFEIDGLIVCPSPEVTTTTTSTAVSTTTSTSVSLCGNDVLDPGETCEVSTPCSGGDVCAQCRCVCSGDVRITFTWSDSNDIDLHVIDPNNEEIYYANPVSSSGGTLDVDANAACDGGTSGVENVCWGTGTAINGTYQVFANYWAHCTGGALQPTVNLEVEVNGMVVLTDSEVLETTDYSCGVCGPCTCEPLATFTYP